MADVSLKSLVEKALEQRVTPSRANRFYDRLRNRIKRLIEKRADLGHVADYLLLAPDVFMLLWRLARDPRVSVANKLLLGVGIAYYVLPIDIIPESIVGPIGYIDDLILGVYILNRVVNDTDKRVVREHWSGEGDVLAMIKLVLDAVDSLVSPRVLAKIKRLAKF